MREQRLRGSRQKELLPAPAEAEGRRDLDVRPRPIIPRHALQMSLAGLRDISVIETPPRGARRPGQGPTSASYEEELVRAGDMAPSTSAGGQGFFLHNNRVEDDRGDGRAPCGALCPGVPLLGRAWADGGRVSSESTMMDYLRGGARRARVPVDHRVRNRHPPGQHADRRGTPTRFGLAQALPDPRSGRAQPASRAYAYLLYGLGGPRSPQEAGPGGSRPLSGLHRARRPASRFAMRATLEIRGAGNPARRRAVPGTWPALGFELYMQMLDEAVRAGRAAAGRRAAARARSGLDRQPSTPFVPG